jgi:CheY-like chemotaxis protein
MLLNIDIVRCLVVEDDPFKIEGVRAYLRDVFGERIQIKECQSLSNATSLLDSFEFDLAIIDMSIHSHEPVAGAGSPFPLSSGGLDVLFEIVHSDSSAHCIILTQYPDIEMEEVPIPVEMAQQAILEKFEIKVAGCVRYMQSDDRWKAEITAILEKL